MNTHEYMLIKITSNCGDLECELHCEVGVGAGGTFPFQCPRVIWEGLLTTALETN